MAKGLPELNWAARFAQQAAWTRSLREHFYRQAALPVAPRLLEVGCGPGALLGELSQQDSSLFGLDIDYASLPLARSAAPSARLAQADAHALPYASSAFDLVYSHFLFLWITEPFQAVREMVRVCRPGGWVAAFAEPDYTARIDFPADLAAIGRWQCESLRRQGARPEFGRRLGSLFAQVGLEHVEYGLLGGQWSAASELAGWQSEWQVVEHDLAQLPTAPPPDEVAQVKEADKNARLAGGRVLFVPTFFAWGRAPGG